MVQPVLVVPSRVAERRIQQKSGNTKLDNKHSNTILPNIKHLVLITTSNSKEGIFYVDEMHVLLNTNHETKYWPKPVVYVHMLKPSLSSTLPLVFLAPLPLSVAHLQHCRSTRTRSSFPVNSIEVERQLGQTAIRAKGQRWCGWCCKKVNEHMHQHALDIHLRSVLSFMFELSLNFYYC